MKVDAIREHLEWRFLQFKYYTSGKLLTRTVGGESVTLGVGSFREFLRAIDYQNEDFVIETLLSKIEPNDVFWDIGANIGTHSCYIGQRGNQIVAIEPHPETASRARENMERNGVDGVVLEYALSDVEGTTSLCIPDKDTYEIGTGTFTTKSGDKMKEIEKVTATTGDNLIEEHELPLPDIIKIDVEGVELDVIRGFKTGLENSHSILVEIHPQHTDIENIRSLLISAGYELRTLRQRNNEIHILGSKLNK
ncbi:FkbM family methyltransferase [Halalkalirubrum salinum]|uniref:FkbM family methyltransferase n=1 Tax=Halalkalirubrum salinum TaxID=2563889 RepID=UPI0010FB70BD|nr:FkbM family methyltransferase [Halalkalirubrum salinum]